MRPTIFVTAAMLTVSTQVQALSCLMPDVGRTFLSADAAEERYVVLLGTFQFDASGEDVLEGMPETPFQPESQLIAAQFSGQSLGAAGFVDSPTLDVQLYLSCAGPWCGSMRPDEATLAFVELQEDDYVLSVDPCYSTTFAPTDANIARVEACVQGGACEDGAALR